MDLGAQDGQQERRLGSRESGNRVEAGIDQIVVFVDEHLSSTEGKYNLSQSIDEEFRLGTYNPEWGTFHGPVFSPRFPKIPVRYLDSRSVTLIRAADITANWIYCAERDRHSYPFAMRSVESTTVLYHHP